MAKFKIIISQILASAMVLSILGINSSFVLAQDITLAKQAKAEVTKLGIPKVRCIL